MRFVVEPALPLARVLQALPPRERALEVFGLLRVWDTEDNAGVLVYLLLADRDVEIVADRGIHRRVGAPAWEAVCRMMEAAFRDGRYADGVEAGIARINALLARHFPAGRRGRGQRIAGSAGDPVTARRGSRVTTASGSPWPAPCAVRRPCFSMPMRCSESPCA